MLALREAGSPRGQCCWRPTTLSETLLTATFPQETANNSGESMPQGLQQRARLSARRGQRWEGSGARARGKYSLDQRRPWPSGTGQRAARVLELVGTTRTPEPADARVVSGALATAQSISAQTGRKSEARARWQHDRVAELRAAHKIHFEKGGASGLVGPKWGKPANLLFFL